MKVKTTDSSKFSNCLIRNRQVANTPEERVRQALLQKMVGEWGFPRGLLSIEKGIGPRRYDLVCYSASMVPLLLVECKAGTIDEAAVRQAFGYNATVQAPFICLAGLTEIKTFWQEQGKVASVPFLPIYQELYAMAQRL